MSAPRPWMKFAPHRWQSDLNLRICSASARGVWIEFICLMHQSETYGHLLVNGRNPTSDELFALTGIRPDVIVSAIEELEAKGVFSRDKKGIIFSRAMVRDERIHLAAVAFGMKGQRAKRRNEKAKQTASSTPSSEPCKSPLKPESEREKESETESESSKTSYVTPRLSREMQLIMEAGDFAAPPPDGGLLNEWKSFGADFDDDILPTIRNVRRQMGTIPYMLKAFDVGIRKRLAEKESYNRQMARMRERYSK